MKLLKYVNRSSCGVEPLPATWRSVCVNDRDPVACITVRPSRASSPSSDSAMTLLPLPGPPAMTTTVLRSASRASSTSASTSSYATRCSSSSTNCSRSRTSSRRDREQLLGRCDRASRAGRRRPRTPESGARRDRRKSWRSPRCCPVNSRRRSRRTAARRRSPTPRPRSRCAGRRRPDRVGLVRERPGRSRGGSRRTRRPARPGAATGRYGAPATSTRVVAVLPAPGAGPLLAARRTTYECRPVFGWTPARTTSARLLVSGRRCSMSTCDPPEPGLAEVVGEHRQRGAPRAALASPARPTPSWYRNSGKVLLDHGRTGSGLRDQLDGTATQRLHLDVPQAARMNVRGDMSALSRAEVRRSADRGNGSGTAPARRQLRVRVALDVRRALTRANGLHRARGC